MSKQRFQITDWFIVFPPFDNGISSPAQPVMEMFIIHLLVLRHLLPLHLHLHPPEEKKIKVRIKRITIFLIFLFDI